MTTWLVGGRERRTRRTGLTTRSDRPRTVAIVGGGASGTILAAQLARRGISSTLIDGSGRAGRGVAYSTSEEPHLLNVRAEAMSAWSGEPDHFAKFFSREGGEPRGFAQRRLFGSYLRTLLDDAVTSGNTQVVEGRATLASRTDRGWQIDIDGQPSLAAELLVIASGNQVPEPLAALANAGGRFIQDPWSDSARAAVEDLASTGEPVLLVGTGLTMVDVAVSLDAAGYAGTIVALSRRGLVPRSHADFVAAPVKRDELPVRLRSLVRWIRRRAAEVGWRAAVDSLRPHSQSLWQNLTPSDQRLFLRHARPWWDVHRHRIAPEVAAAVARMIANGVLTVVAGRIECAAESPDGIVVDYRRRGSDAMQSDSFAYAFNCTGPLHNIKSTKDALLQSLLSSGDVHPDHLGIGLDVEVNCRAGDKLWAIGPLTKGRFWESTAVPDIREQAAEIADDIEAVIRR